METVSTRATVHNEKHFKDICSAVFLLFLNFTDGKESETQIGYPFFEKEPSKRSNMAKRIATDQKYTVGSPFHFEMLFNPPGGFDETITISGVVVYNNGEIAVVKVSFRFFEFEGVVHTIEETRKRFPDYEPADTPKHDDEYLWIRTSIDGFDGFIPNEEF